MLDKDNNKPKGYGFADYMDQSLMDAAVRLLNGRDVHGRPIRVDFADHSDRERIRGAQGALSSLAADSAECSLAHPSHAFIQHECALDVRRTAQAAAQPRGSESSRRGVLPDTTDSLPSQGHRGRTQSRCVPGAAFPLPRLL